MANDHVIFVSGPVFGSPEAGMSVASSHSGCVGSMWGIPAFGISSSDVTTAITHQDVKNLIAAVNSLRSKYDHVSVIIRGRQARKRCAAWVRRIPL